MARPKKEVTEEVKEVSTLEEVLLKEDKAKKKPDDEEIEVIFSNLEERGHTQDFGFGTTKNHRCETIKDGQRIVLPRWYIRAIEKLKTPLYEYVPDGTGKQRKVLVGYKNRFSCKQVF